MLLELQGVAGEGDVVIGGKQGNHAEHEAAEHLERTQAIQVLGGGKVVLILADLADLAAPECCLAAVGLRVGLGMATRHPGVWRWRVEPCDRAQEINATTCHTRLPLEP